MLELFARVPSPISPIMLIGRALKEILFYQGPASLIE
jgi:hypothetical protein